MLRGIAAKGRQTASNNPKETSAVSRETPQTSPPFRSNVPAQPLARLQFRSDWREIVQGTIRRGEQLSIEYDPARLPQCRQNLRGAEVWDMEAFVRFHPRGEVVTGSVLRKRRQPPEFGMVVALESIPLQMQVPTDTTRIELWFHNFCRDSSRCDSWDSRFGQNYWFDPAGEPPRNPRQPVSYRRGAIASPEMVNVQAQAVFKKNVFPLSPNVSPAGTDLQTLASVKAWVKNIAYAKNVWMDVHVFDGADDLVHSETFTLGYAGCADGMGDLFTYDGKLYQGSTAVSDSVSAKPDARKVQYRLYYEVNGQILTDAILHQRELLEDAIV